ncbi:MAG: 16S rRNA (adenine(1518)-N(6)/adenine(1519)-N(6))-dimethyltransferase RsmA [Bacteroidota bacterium]
MYSKPKKSLGQHFLTDKNIAAKIVNSIQTESPSSIIEIGPGRGVLTDFLINRFPETLQLIEIDTELSKSLLEKYPSLNKKILNADFLTIDQGYFSNNSVIIGNFPYNISSQIFFKILSNKEYVQEVVCMLQKEVAERISSSHNNKTYGILSVLLQAHFDIKYLFSVNPQVFSPPPNVKSAVIRLERKKNIILDYDEQLFIKIVKASFNHRRKILKNSLLTIFPLMSYKNPVFQKRPEQLAVKDFIFLTNLISDLNKS